VLSDMPPSAPGVFHLSHSSIWSISGGAAGSIFVLFAVATMIGWVRGTAEPLVSLLQEVGFCAVLACFFAAVLYYVRWKNRVEVTPHGIDSIDISGDPCFVRWSLMHEASYYTAYRIVPCLLIVHTLPGSEPLQIPLRLDRRAEFIALVNRYAGEQASLFGAFA